MARLNYKEVLKGDTGYTFEPHVTVDGILYWTNNGNLKNPLPVNLHGKQGEQGERGERGFCYTPLINEDGILSWTNNGNLENPNDFDIKELMIDEVKESRINIDGERFATLSERLKNNDTKIRSEKIIRENNNKSMLNIELSNCFNTSPNLWDKGDITVDYESGQTWVYKSFQIDGFEIDNNYCIGLTTALNHVNDEYIIEIQNHNTKVLKTNKPYVFTAKSETITFIIQCISSKATIEKNKALYSGIFIRKNDITLKDSLITKNYSISDIGKMDSFLNFPTFILENKKITCFGGSKTWTNYGVEFDIKGDEFYTIEYESVLNNRLNPNEPLIVALFKDSNNNNIGSNVDLIKKDGEKTKTFNTPLNAKKIKLMFVVTLSNTYGEDVEVVWNNVNFYKGKSKDVKIKENALVENTHSKNEIFELNLPKNIYASIGYPLEIYHNVICRCANMNNYMFVWKLPKGGGSAFKDKLLLNPKDNLNKTSDMLTLEVYDNNYNLIDTQTSTVHYIKLDSTTMPQSKKKVLCLGDSLTDISKWREELFNRFNSVESGKIEFLGTLGTTPYKHEGHSGWSLNSYLVNSQEGWNGNYKIRVAQAPNITPKKQYRFDRKIFEYEKTEVENGATWVYFNRISGGGYVTTSDSPCIEVDTSVSGDKTIEFTDAQRTSFNPFFNNGGFDCKYYSDTYLNSVIPDDVIIWLGTNGGKPSLNMKSVKTDVAEEMKKYKTIIDNIKSNWVNTKIFICYLHLRPNQNGMGNVDGLTCSKAWDNYIFEFNKQLFETFKDYPNVIFVPTGQTLDRVNNYYQKEIDINTRNTKKITVANDPVHPYVQTGFMQFADAIFGAYINNMEV